MMQDNGTEAKQGRKGGKPRRKLSWEHVNYCVSGSDIVFRWDSCCAIIKKSYNNKVSQYQVKVLLAVDHLMKRDGLLCVSYQTIDVGGVIRGMLWQDVIRSLVVLHECGLLETLGKTTGGKYYKYHPSREGDALLAWIHREMSAPNEIITFQSKLFDAPSDIVPNVA